jgi:hypothetical protein
VNARIKKLFGVTIGYGLSVGSIVGSPLSDEWPGGVAGRPNRFRTLGSVEHFRINLRVRSNRNGNSTGEYQYE